MQTLYATALLTEEINRIRPKESQIVIPQIDARLWTHYHTTWWPHHLTKTIMYRVERGTRSNKMATSVRALTICWLLSVFTHFSAAQNQSSLCTDGSGGFQEAFRTGVSVRVGASRDGELATRKCEAELSWNNRHLAVAAGASQVDLDAFGADLGLGVPVASFQVKQVDSPCCAEYQVYSLRHRPGCSNHPGRNYFQCG